MTTNFRCLHVKGEAGRYFEGSKRVFDFTVALVGLVILSPLFLLLGIVISATSSGSPFFVADRVGVDGRHFWMVKFRSMVKGAHSGYAQVRGESTSSRNGPYFKNPKDSRITPVGKFLRSWSLDELPQLVNVLRGEMSLVGPRPAFREEVEEMGKDAVGRHTIRPGMTGICQVNGRTSIPYPDYVMLERHYLEHRCWKLDLCILGATFRAVVSKAGAH